MVGVALEIDESITSTTHTRIQFFSDAYMQQKEDKENIFGGLIYEKGQYFSFAVTCTYLYISYKPGRAKDIDTRLSTCRSSLFQSSFCETCLPAPAWNNTMRAVRVNQETAKPTQ